MVFRVKRFPENLVFFALCFVYLWLVVEPHLIYHCYGTILSGAPQYATGWSFLADSVGTPGGFVTYASGFLSQGYYHAWLGAAIIVLAGFCLAELCRRHLATAGLARGSVLSAIPAIMLFLLYSHYRHPLAVCLAVLLGLLLSLAFETLPIRRRPVRVATGCLMATVGFWLGGGGTFLVFSLVTAAYGLLARRDWTTVVLALPASVAIAWFLAEYVFLIPWLEAFLILTPLASPSPAGVDPLLRVATFLLVGFVPLAVLLVLVVRNVFGRRGREPGVRSGKIRGKGKHAATRRARPFLSSLVKPAVSAVPIALMALVLYVSHEELRKPYVLSNYYFRQKRWDDILELGRRLPKGRNNVYVNHDILCALYHTGRLPYDMFQFPQNPDAILLTHERTESDLTLSRLSDDFLELGHVNMAEKLASELLATKSHLGLALEKLAWISIIKGRPGTARVYLKALTKDLVYRGRAESLLHGLDRGFPQDQAAYVDRIRSCMRGDAAEMTGREPIDHILTGLLEHNPRNRMAFEYRMACYLLTGRVDKIAESIARLDDLGYQRIPTLYEEAVLIYYGSQKQRVDLAGFSISRETLQRYQTFVQIRGAMRPENRQAVLNRLIREFGTSYFFYFSFGRVGLV